MHNSDLALGENTMRIGFNLLLWTGHVTQEHLSVLERLKFLEYDLVEIPVMTGSVEHYAQIGRWLDDIGLPRTTSMAFTDPARDPLSAAPKVRHAALDQLRWQIDCAQAMGATKVVGPMYQVLGHFSGLAPTADERCHAADILRAAASQAHEAGIQLVIEPLNRFECHLCNTLDSAVALVQRVNHPAVGMMVDTFHTHIEENDVCDAIISASKVIEHVHLSENNRGTPGQGQINFKEIIRTLRSIQYDGDFVVEAFGRSTPELAAATRIWRDQFSSPEQLARDAIGYLKPLLR